jgi:hypothetical protein
MPRKLTGYPVSSQVSRGPANYLKRPKTYFSIYISILLEIMLTVSLLMLSSRCEYRKVILIDVCPINLLTSNNETPDCTNQEAKVCLKEWKIKLRSYF